MDTPLTERCKEEGKSLSDICDSTVLEIYCIYEEKELLQTDEYTERQEAVEWPLMRLLGGHWP